MITADRSEEALISAALANNHAYNKAVATSGVTADDFLRPSRQVAWKAISRIVAEGRTADTVTLTAELERTGELEQAGGDHTIATYALSYVAPSNAPSYAQDVVRAARWRRINQAGAELQKAAETADEVAVAQARRLIDEHNKGRTKPTIEQLQELALDMLDEPTEMLPFPFPDLTEKTGGIEPGHLIIVAAHTSHGKSIFIDQTLDRCADKGLTCHLYMNEMTEKARLRRSIARATGINTRDMRAGRMDKLQREKYGKAIANLNWTMSEITGWSPEEVAADIVASDYDIVAVDLLNRFMLKGPERHELLVGEAVNCLANAAKKSRTAILLASQLNRANSVGKSYPPQPTLADIRNSGDISNHADNVVFVYRKEDPDSPGLAGTDTVISVMKGRDSGMAAENVKFDPNRLEFRPVGAFGAAVPTPDDDDDAWGFGEAI